MLEFHWQDVKFENGVRTLPSGSAVNACEIISPYVTLATGLRYSAAVTIRELLAYKLMITSTTERPNVRFSGISSMSFPRHSGQYHVSGGGLAGLSPTQLMWYQLERSRHFLLSHAIISPKLEPLHTQYSRGFRPAFFFLTTPLPVALADGECAERRDVACLDPLRPPRRPAGR